MDNNIIIIGGSGSLKDEKNKIEYDKMYPALISENINQLKLFNLSKPGNDVTEAILGLYKKLHKIKPQIAIIDLGLVDCSPRVFSRRELVFLLSLPESIQRLTYGIQKKHRKLATKIRKKVYVPIDLFYENYSIIIEQCSLFCSQVCLIYIAKPTDYVCNKSYRMHENIIAYNEKIKELAKEHNCSLIDLFSATEDDVSLLAHDGYHLSELGHYFIYKEFTKLLFSSKEGN